MLFNSNEFLIFLAVVLIVYYSLHSLRWQNMLLLVASYLFYAAWDWRFCALLLITSGVDFVVGKSLVDLPAGSQRQRVLAMGLAVNLGMLFFFKYFNFFVDSAVHGLNTLGISASPVTLAIILPVGISFYTFQSIAYKLDVYRGIQEPERDPLIMGLFTVYFPQLVAGPIERGSHVLPQFRQRSLATREQIESGIVLILIGLFRKVVIADVAAGLINAQVFVTPNTAPAGRVLVGIYLYALQIYGDFAGYSDIARGVSRLFGIELVENFNQPYFATSIADFWRRWHISLSNWLRDYLFMPFSRSLLRRYGNRHASAIVVVSHLVTMSISGLWHGANWTFVVWGFMHGVLLGGHRLLQNQKVLPIKVSSSISKRILALVSIIVTFHVVAITWVFFRAPSLEVAFGVLQRALIDLRAPEIIFQIGRPLALFALLFMLDGLQAHYRDHTAIRRLPLVIRSLVYVVIVYGVCLFWSSLSAPFIYAKF
jgi:D-alanyl-lipoteichoic acid acyltransferase DltB (MBOAT superfamily)